MNRITEFMALARLALWLDIPVGVYEEETATVFTLVIKFPNGVVYKRIPRNRLEGHWPRLPLAPEDLDQTDRMMNYRLRQIVNSSMKKTIETTLDIK